MNSRIKTKLIKRQYSHWVLIPKRSVVKLGLADKDSVNITISKVK